MQGAVTIERFDLSEKDKLLAFLGKAFAENPRQSDDEFWSWHFVESPHSKPEKMPVWLAKSGERIAGQLAAIPVELKVGTEILPSMWILDFVVDPEFRRQGIGKRLVLAAEESCDVLLGVNTMEQHAPALLQGLGWKIVGKIPRFHGGKFFSRLGSARNFKDQTAFQNRQSRLRAVSPAFGQKVSIRKRKSSSARRL